MPVNYDSMSDMDISIERQVLESYVFYLNQQLNTILKQRTAVSRGPLASRRKSKLKESTSKPKYNEWDSAGIESQVRNNFKLILLLREELTFLFNKLNKYQHSENKIKCEQQILETQQQIAKMKMNLVERKRKNVLNDKKLTSISKSEIDHNK